MSRILDYNGREADRTVTVASIIAARGFRPPLVQVTAGTPEEAAAAEEAGIDMVVCMAGAVPAVRRSLVVGEDGLERFGRSSGRFEGIGGRFD